MAVVRRSAWSGIDLSSRARICADTHESLKHTDFHARAARDYTERHYLPAAATYQGRQADHAAIGTQIVAWQQQLDRGWSKIHLAESTVESHEGTHKFGLRVHLGDLDPEAVRLEMYADAPDGGDPFCQAMTRLRTPGGPAGEYAYSATIVTNRLSVDFTGRVVAYHDGVAVPLENSHIACQR